MKSIEFIHTQQVYRIGIQSMFVHRYLILKTQSIDMVIPRCLQQHLLCAQSNPIEGETHSQQHQPLFCNQPSIVLWSPWHQETSLQSFGLLQTYHCTIQSASLGEQARNIEQQLRRRIWKHEVIHFLIDYIICDCIFDYINYDCIFDYINFKCIYGYIICDCIFDYIICDCIYYYIICDCS